MNDWYDAVAVRESVEARCRRDGGPLGVVTCVVDRTGAAFAESRSPYGALALAKELVRNRGYSDVQLELYGRSYAAAEILSLRF